MGKFCATAAPLRLSRVANECDTVVILTMVISYAVNKSI